MSHGDTAGERATAGDRERELLLAGREVHRLHREVEALREQLASERTEREELLEVVSHELRTPITVVGGYLRLLLGEESGSLNEAQRRFLEESRRSIERLDAFVVRVLDGTRKGRPGEFLEVAARPLGSVIEEVVASFRPVVEAHGASVDLALEPGLEATFDRDAVERVLLNLLGNAIRYTPSPGRIEVSSHGIEESGRSFAAVSVRDHGPGVAAADRARIFEAYVQAGPAAEAGELGLGLAICRRLVEAHGGTIGVESPEEGGSRFRFTLPREATR